MMATKKEAAKKPAEKKEFKKLKARVVGGTLNVRKQPSKDAEIKRVLESDETVEVIGQDKEWYQIKGGWIMAQFTERI